MSSSLLEDYDPQYGNDIDGCPADFVPWYDADYDGIQDHIDNCPTVKETYNLFQDEDGCPDLSPDGTKPIAMILMVMDILITRFVSKPTRNI